MPGTQQSPQLEQAMLGVFHRSEVNVTTPQNALIHSSGRQYLILKAMLT